MTLGPIEVVTIAFERGNFRGEIIAELQRLVDSRTISIVDGVFLQRDDDDEITYLEVGDDGADESVKRIAELMDRVEGLLAEEDIDILADTLPLGGAAAILVFEHTWFLPLREAILNAGGEFLDALRIPGTVVQEVLDAIDAIDEEEE